MEITRIPEPYASLRGELVYTLTDTAPRNFDIAVLDIASDETVGVKRFLDTAQVRFDAAPYLRQRLFFLPETGPTGFLSAAGRTLQATIAVDGQRAPVRTFTPAPAQVVPPAHLTTRRGSRPLAAGDCDELTFCTAEPCRALLTIFSAAGEQRALYTAPQPGYVLFRLNTADFPEAEMLRLEVPGLTVINYPLTGPAGCRVAWRSGMGSIEHYTFPVVVQDTHETQREGITAASGFRLASLRSARVLTLRSDYEPRRVRTALEEVLTAPAVWHIEEGIYHPVEVVTEASGMRSRGTLRNLQLCIRHPFQTLVP